MDEKKVASAVAADALPVLVFVVVSVGGNIVEKSSHLLPSERELKARQQGNVDGCQTSRCSQPP